jgi:hypothetical protein
MQPPHLSQAPNYILEMRLEKRHHAILQLRKFLGVAFAAKDFVPNLCQASRCR